MVSRLPRRRRRFVSAALGLLALVAVGSLAAVAVAATRNGVTPLAPEVNQVVERGAAPVFSVRARGGGAVFVRVCRSPKPRASDGLICADETVGRAVRGGSGLYRFQPRVYAFPQYWLNRAGTYYWQAHRIRCERRRTRDCRQEGPVQAIRVE